MKFDTLHPILQRQFTKSGFSEADLENEKLVTLIERVNKAYNDADQARYLKERALEISSKEMQELYTKINYEKKSLEMALNELIEKDALLNEKNIELIRQRNYAASLVASISDMLFITDERMLIKDINQNVTTELHIEKSDAIGLNLEQFFSDIEPIRALVKKQDIQERYVDYMAEIKVNESNKNIPVLISASIILDIDQHSHGIICIVKDISELKRLEKENTDKMLLLSHAGRLAALGEMATGIAHELNQPLAIIKMNMQTLEFFSQDASLTHEDSKEIVTTVIQQVDRASRIINHMRAFARKQDVIAEPIDLRVPIRQALSMFNEQFRLHEIQIIEDYPNDLPLIHTDEQQFEQIIVNLLSNAKYALETRHKNLSEDEEHTMQIHIKLSYDVPNKNVILEVSDNGVGMTPDIVDRCLEPFFTTKDIGEGTGLGLSIVYNFVKELNGDIQIESTPKKGSVFRILLPISSSAACEKI